MDRGVWRVTRASGPPAGFVVALRGGARSLRRRDRGAWFQVIVAVWVLLHSRSVLAPGARGGSTAGGERMGQGRDKNETTRGNRGNTCTRAHVHTDKSE